MKRIFLGLLFSLYSVVLHARPLALYGPDSRREVYQESNQTIVRLADSTAVQIDKADFIDVGNNKYRIKSASIGEHYKLCSTEAFVNQPAAGDCSGFLVAPDLLATAGHCSSFKDCSHASWVFGYRMKTDGSSPLDVEQKNVYNCKKIVAREYTYENQDWALIRLDRPVIGVQPLRLRKQPNLTRGDSLFIIGHPMGLPTKIADGEVLNFPERSYFVTAMDSFGGNSGSPVFNYRTYEVEGILVRGDDDFVNVGVCRKAKPCTEATCTGEDVSDISYVTSMMQKLRSSP